MSAAGLAQSLGAKPTGPGKWQAKCPYHEDKEPSLSITAADDGGTLVHCHAGCQDVYDRLWQGGYIEAQSPSSGQCKPEAVYEYRDIGGRIVYEVVRLPGKQFRGRRPNGEGGWVWSVPAESRIPYRLPEVLAASLSELVFVVEGEKDADCLAACGLVATTNPFGAGKWRREYNEHFRDRRVVIVPDNDDAGREHATAVYESLRPVAASVRILSLTNHVGLKCDVSDLIAAGGPGAFHRLVERLPPPKVRRRPYLSLNDLDALPGPEWLVDGLIPKRSVVLLYGDSGVGKSFVAIHVGLRTASGEPVLGRPARRGLVLYAALEGSQGIKDRTRAGRLETYAGLSGTMPFVARIDPLNLADTESVGELVSAMHEAEREYGADAALIVIDTLSRSMPGANENSPDDMSRAIAGISRLQEDTGATVLVIHHSGKTAERGARGHSSLRAAVDAELLVSVDKRGRALTITKQRDGADQIRIPFELAVVTIPAEDGGQAAESRVVRHLQEEVGDGPNKSLSTKTRLAYKALQEAARSQGRVLSADDRQGLDIPPDTRVVTSSEWLDACRKLKLTESSEEALKKARSRAAKNLRSAGLLGEAGDYCWATPARQTADGQTGQDRSAGHKKKKGQSSR